MNRLVLGVAAALLVASVGCGGDAKERIAVSESKYLTLLADATSPRGLVEIKEAMLAGQSEAHVSALVDQFRRDLEDRVDALEAVVPPEDAEYGHELLVDALRLWGGDVAEVARAYRSGMTADQADLLSKRLDEAASLSAVRDAVEELNEVGFVFTRPA